jgi:hypothetical protein
MAENDSLEIQNRIVGIIGRKGSGKSRALEGRLMAEDRVFVWDAMGEHDWSPNELRSMDDVQEFFRWNRKKQRWAANYVPGDELSEELETLCPVLYDRGEMIFAIEEIPLVCSASHLPPKLGKLIRTGRHRQLDVVWTAQRASEVSRTLTSLTDEFILFSQTEPLDLDAIAKRCGAEVADRVAHLGRHDFITWDVADRRLSDSPALSSPKAAAD